MNPGANLQVVADNDLKAALPVVETVARRVQRLQAEAKQLARDHVAALTTAMASLEELAAEVAEGGDAYPPGVRDVAQRLADDLDSRIQTLTAIQARTA
jgi:hypothetical protein